MLSRCKFKHVDCDKKKNSTAFGHCEAWEIQPGLGH